MKRFLPAVGLIALGLAIILTFRTPAEPAVNPDPNHTHADFAVWIDGEKLDFTDPQFMSEVYEEGQEVRVNPMRKYLHLHDGIGHVIHRHKPGLALEDFFVSLSGEGNPVGFHRNVSARINYFTFCICKQPNELECPCAPAEVRLFVNGTEVEDGPSYVFNDGDQLLITNATDDAEVKRELEQLSNDACLYSKTCPERGDPPAENCIADPEVPCVLPD